MKLNKKKYNKLSNYLNNKKSYEIKLKFKKSKTLLKLKILLRLRNKTSST